MIRHWLDEGGGELRKLNLSGNIQLGDRTLAAIGLNCPHLTHLDMTGCRDVSDFGITRLFAHGQVAELTVLEISMCSMLTDRSLIVMSKRSAVKRLNTISVSHAVGITDRGVTALIKANPQLKHLGIDNCGHVTDKWIHMLQGDRAVSVDMWDCDELQEATWRFRPANVNINCWWKWKRRDRGRRVADGVTEGHSSNSRR